MLAQAHGLSVTAHHVDHAIRSASATEAELAAAIAERLGIPIVVHRSPVAPGPNLEARARTARAEALPPDSMTGHTLDDQAETVLLRLLRGSGSSGLSAMRPGFRHPILALRRAETTRVCEELGIIPVQDPSNGDAAMRRNRVRSELIPLANDIADRDVALLLDRTAALSRADDEFLELLAADIDPTDARAVASAPVVLARRALRRWLAVDGYPPDAAAIERVLAVARGQGIACEINGGRRVERSEQHFRIVVQER